MKKLILFTSGLCIMIFVVAFLKSNRENRNVNALQTLLPLLKTDNGWRVDKADVYGNSPSDKGDTLVALSKNSGFLSLHLDQMDEKTIVILGKSSQLKLNHLAEGMMKNKISYLRRDGEIVYFFGKNSLFSKGTTIVYSPNPDLWDPMTHKSKWFSNPNSLRRTDRNWFTDD